MSLFITFEGGEGSGKSLQAKTLYRRLYQLDIPALLIREPGSTPLGERLTRLLKWSKTTETCPTSELMLFNASRAQLICDVILPALSEEKVVVCDRFTDSTLAYQGYGGRQKLDEVSTVNNIATSGLTPDVTFLLDIPVKDGLARKQSKTADRFEAKTIAFHERVRQGYLELAEHEPERFVVIDARLSKKEIAHIIWDKVSNLLSLA